MSVIGEYMIHISTNMIDQLTDNDEKVKRKVRKPKSKKLIEKQQEPQDNGRELQSELKSGLTPVPWFFCRPHVLPATSSPPTPPMFLAIHDVKVLTSHSQSALSSN